MTAAAAAPRGAGGTGAPAHVAVIMDGNGRWANQRGLPRIEGHRHGEAQLLDVVRGCIDVGVRWISAYAFSTENWKRSPEEVRFLMGFNREVIHRRRDQLHAWGVRRVSMSSVRVWRANGGGAAGTGWVVARRSPSMSEAGAGRYSIGKSGFPVVRSKTKT